MDVRLATSMATGHSAIVALTGRAEAYYSDHRGTPQELISAARFGYLFQGQHYAWQKQRRGTPGLDLAGDRFINYLQNHDQIANSGDGARIHQLTSPGELRAMTTLLLLMPAHAMLFQGQEFAASAPFLFFADHRPDLAEQVLAGRRSFLSQFPGLAAPDVQQRIDDPAARATFERSRLDWSERERNAHILDMHRDLIRLARTDPVFAAQDAANLYGAVLSERAFVLRFVHTTGDRLLVVNLGADLEPGVVPEPLLAPPLDSRWALHWSSEDPAWGGHGVVPPEIDGRWRIAGRAAVVLIPAASE